jgi:serine/threonine protein kinase
MSAEFAPVGLPASIGPYRVVRELGRGGMGIVYEAVHSQLGKRVAIKTLRSHLLEDRANVQRFLREGRAACHIRHPHVVEIFELGSHAGAPYLAMDLLEGVHLGNRLEQQGPIPLPALIDLMLPILSAVSAAHAAGVVHRDLKPSNIMLSLGHDGGTVPKVLDFGTSKLRGQGIEDQMLTITGAVLGTLHYMSPEQTRAPKDADAQSDQYSLGLILYECATGKKPFLAESVYDVMQAIMTAPIEPPSTLNPALPKTFDEVVLRAMSRRPYDRYPSVAALGVALLPFASEDGRRLWERELSAVALALPTESRPRPPAATHGSATDHQGSTLPESNDLRGHARSNEAKAVRALRRWRGIALTAVLIPVIVAAAYWLFDRPQPIDSHPHLAPSAEAPRLELRETAPPPATPLGQRADITTPSAETEGNVGELAPTEAPKPTVRTKKRPVSSARVRLGDNGAPILE